MKKFLLLSLVMLLAGCSSAEEKEAEEKERVRIVNLDYSDVSDKMIEVEDIFLLSGDFYVYVYDPECSHCISIKQDMIDYSLERDDFYFLQICDELTDITTKTSFTSKGSSLDELYVGVVPTLLVVSDYEVIDYYSGTCDILTYLEISE